MMFVPSIGLRWNRSGRAECVLFLAALVLSVIVPARGCATVYPEKITSENFIESEQAVIIWDEANKVEHFIRRAEIQTKAPDMGFLVPTPQTPELVEVDPRIFKMAEDVARPALTPYVIGHTPLEIFAPVLAPSVFLALGNQVKGVYGMRRPDGLDFIEEKDIAGYHAVVIQADNTPALAQWLKENGYAWTPETEAWLQPYVAAKWKITAFKLIQPATPFTPTSESSDSLTTRAIRMSFSTDRPFFPYGEPSSEEKAEAASPYGRTLRVAILSNERMKGTLADGTVWSGELRFAGSSTPRAIPRQSSITGIINLPDRTHPTDQPWKADEWLAFAKLENTSLTLPKQLTYFRDDSNPRSGNADLYFSVDPNPATFRASEIDYTHREHRIDLSNPLSDLGGFLIFLLIPGAPLYCGWRVLSPLFRKTPSLMTEYCDLPCRVITAINGCWQGIGCFFMAIFALFLPFENDPDVLWLCPLGLVISLILLSLCGSMIYCAQRLAHPDLSQSRLTFLGVAFSTRRWDGVMGGGSVLAGLLFLLMCAWLLWNAVVQSA